ncbi:hypothetical protein [Enteractinococcus coprophilus]|uniref:Uncharacterized protein n=1 Tax=Enteractinococcus coprophilus TaxID=1027633 RepID=A0A543ANC1_9MICC|nr:hypothetical protein FB556_0496 [Enteractinococcus coprophilus]
MNPNYRGRQQPAAVEKRDRVATLHGFNAYTVRYPDSVIAERAWDEVPC